MPLIVRILRALGVDTNVGWTVLARLASMAAGFVALFPVARFLTPVEQGYYYTFASITALQVLFELGLTQILVQLTSHEFPFLPKGMPLSDAPRHHHGRRLTYFAAFADRWYRIASVLFLLVVTLLGLLYFTIYGTLAAATWVPQWICLVLLTSINLYLSPRLAFIEGAGFPGKVAALRLSQTLIGFTGLIAALWAGFALWAVVALPLAQVVMSAVWLARHRTVPNFFRRELRLATPEPGWRGEIMSLQWRVALSWVGGYLATLAFTPLLFAYQGAVAAGQWGLTFTVFTQVSALGISWTSARAPRFGELIARRDRARLDREFFAATMRSTALVLLLCMAFVAAVQVATWWNIALVDRLMRIPDMALLGIATVGSTLVFCLATYVRAHKEEPLAASSLVIGSATAASAYFAAQAGIYYVALAYMAVTLAINLPWRYYIYRAYRRRIA